MCNMHFCGQTSKKNKLNEQKKGKAKAGIEPLGTGMIETVLVVTDEEEVFCDVKWHLSNQNLETLNVVKV